MAINSEVETFVIDDDSDSESPQILPIDLDEDENRYLTMNSDLDKQVAQDMQAIREYIDKSGPHDPLKNRIEFFNSIDTSYLDNTSTHIFCQQTGLGTIKCHECTHCDFKTEDKTKLQQHIIVKHTELGNSKWYKCQICEFIAQKESDIKRHKSSVHENLCEICGGNFDSVRNLMKHRSEKHDFEIFECTQCDYITEKKSDLSEHTLTHLKLNVSWYKCQMCEYRTATKVGLNRHISFKHAFIY